MARRRTCDCGTCKKCRHREYMRGWYQRMTPEQRRAWVARRDPVKVREQDRLKQARRRREGTAEQKLRIAARAAVQKALWQGLLVIGPCEQEGADCAGRKEAHHDDYTKPLAVRWLCRHHHTTHHALDGVDTEGEAA